MLGITANGSAGPLRQTRFDTRGLVAGRQITRRAQNSSNVPSLWRRPATTPCILLLFARSPGPATRARRRQHCTTWPKHSRLSSRPALHGPLKRQQEPHRRRPAKQSLGYPHKTIRIRRSDCVFAPAGLVDSARPWSHPHIQPTLAATCAHSPFLVLHPVTRFGASLSYRYPHNRIILVSTSHHSTSTAP